MHWFPSVAPFSSLWLQPEYWRHRTVQHLPLWHSPLLHLEPPDSHHPGLARIGMRTVGALHAEDSDAARPLDLRGLTRSERSNSRR